MKTGILTALVTLCLAAGARADLETTTPILNLGDIRGGMPLQVTFPLVNRGEAAITILEIKRGCDCLTPQLDKRLLQPGDKTTLSMAVRTLGHAEGPHAWTASVRYRMGDAERELPLAIRATIKNDVTVQPAACALFVESTLRQEVTLTDRRQPRLTVTRAQTALSAIKVEVKSQACGTTKIILEASAAGLAPGRYSDVLSIYTNDSMYPHLQVPITLIRLSDKAVMAAPEDVKLIANGGEAIPSTLIRLRARDDQAVVIEKATADDPAVTCTWAAGPGTYATLRIRVNATRSLETIVRVQLREPVRETLTIPVQINIR
jgi:hypothetical protein